MFQVSGITGKLNQLLTDWTTALSTKLNINCDAQISTKANQTTANTINTNVSTLLGRVPAGSSDSWDAIGRPPAVVNTLNNCVFSQTTAISLGTGIDVTTSCDDFAQGGSQVATANTWYNFVNISSGAGVLQFAAVGHDSISSIDQDLEIIIDGTTVLSLTKALARYYAIVGVGVRGVGSSPIYFWLDRIPFLESLVMRTRIPTADTLLFSYRFYRWS